MLLLRRLRPQSSSRSAYQPGCSTKAYTPLVRSALVAASREKGAASGRRAQDSPRDGAALGACKERSDCEGFLRQARKKRIFSLRAPARFPRNAVKLLSAFPFEFPFGDKSER